MSKYGLDENVVGTLCRLFATMPHIDRAIIYGSRAKGCFRPNSDIDLTFEGAALTRRDLSVIDAAIDDLLLPYTFDLSIKSMIANPGLLTEIGNHGKTFYQKQPGTPTA